MNTISSILCFVGCFSSIALADILVYTQFNNQLIEEFRDLPARFGQQLPQTGLKLFIVSDSASIFGCKELNPAPMMNDTQVKWGIILKRSNCEFEVKVRNAQRAGYDAAIVYNNNSNDLETMSAKNGSDIFISSVFVGETTGSILINNYLYPNGFVIVINDDLPFNINTHLILPFSIVVGLVFIIIVGFMIVKCVREQRRLRRRRLPRSVLKTIPIVKYNKTHPYETCAICLDDYVEGDKLRVLPCAHAYHSKCIDPWLLKTRRWCPVCKRKVLPPRHARPVERHSSEYSSSDSDADDTTPLINPVENTNNHGTFMQTPSNDGDDNQSERLQRRENPFNRSVNDSPDLSEERLPTYWSRLLSVFRQTFSANRINVNGNNETNENSQNPVSPSSIVSISVDVPVMVNSSNNILNVNLSGSFRDNNDTLLIPPQPPPEQHQHQQQQQQQQQQQLMITEPEPSSSTSSTSYRTSQSSHNAPRVGVAALPNTNFNDCPQHQSQSGYNFNNRNKYNSII